MSSTNRPGSKSDYDAAPKRLLRPSKVPVSMLSTQKSATEHDRQNAGKRAPGPMGTMEGGRPPGPWGSTAREIYEEAPRGVMVVGKSRLVGQFLKLAFTEEPDIRWVAPDSPTSVTWVRQRRQVHSSGAYLADRGMSGETARDLDIPVPLLVTLTLEDDGRDTTATISRTNRAAAAHKKTWDDRMENVTSKKRAADKAMAILAMRAPTGDHWGRRAEALARLGGTDEIIAVLGGMASVQRRRAFEALRELPRRLRGVEDETLAELKDRRFEQGFQRRHREVEAQAAADRAEAEEAAPSGGRSTTASDPAASAASRAAAAKKAKKQRDTVCSPGDVDAFLAAVLDRLVGALERNEIDEVKIELLKFSRKQQRRG